MRRKGFKGRTEKKALSKSKGVVKLYDEIQSIYADILQSDSEIVEIRCNVFLDGLELGSIHLILYVQR